MRAKRRSIAVFLIMCFVFGGIFFEPEAVLAAKISSAAKAREKAMKKVPNAVVTEVDSDYEKGVLVYDVELVKGNKKFDIKYRASNGKMLEYGWETQYVEPFWQNESISMSRCKRMARKKVKKAKIVSCLKKRDDGITVYKVKLTTGKKRFTLVYHAGTGELLEYEWELKTTVSTKPGSSESHKGYIGVSKAKEIALALVPGGVVVKAEFDMDDGVPVYEVDLIKGNYEYEFEIHAKTGKVLKQDVDWND